MSQPRWGVVQDSEWRFQDTAGSRVGKRVRSHRDRAGLHPTKPCSWAEWHKPKIPALGR